jgi:NIPSNAP
MRGGRFRVPRYVTHPRDPLRAPFTFAQHEKAHDALRPFLRSRATQIAQEFAFLPTSPPHNEGGIFELRAYQLAPGTLLEWEATWYAFYATFDCYASDCIILHRRKGIEARRKFVEPVGAWFAQIGRLNQVYHLWQYQCVPFAAHIQSGD